ncbi:MAG: c-type cytochrome [Bacteroidetes bacterium]|nr:c-type cytochrome [Bacteroidota bacterium]
MGGRYTFLIIGLIGFFACQSSTKQMDDAPEGSSTHSAAVASVKDPVYAKGLALVGKNDCVTCHKVDDKLIGPSYKEVAKKYADAPNDVVTVLASFIIKGGGGNWGNVPMTPHSNLSQEDAETMVRYILTLKQ